MFSSVQDSVRVGRLKTLSHTWEIESCGSCGISEENSENVEPGERDQSLNGRTPLPCGVDLSQKVSSLF